MKKLTIYIMMFCLLVNTGGVVKASTEHVNFKKENITEYDIRMKQDLLCLMMAYPEYVTNVERQDNGLVYLVMKSGKKILYDDKKTKNFEQKLANTDLQDMMDQIYPLSPIKNVMDKDFDPGRFRTYELLKEVYGGSKEQIQPNLKNVNVGYKKYQFNGNNNAAEALKEVMEELTPLAQKRGDIGANAFPAGGTFNYRYIKGTNRLSPHSFGIAVDLKVDKRDYWKWNSKEVGEKRLASYPKEIAEIFEKNNFVWGGKWSHFDIMHFEYRPEIVLKARYFWKKQDEEKVWYDGVPCDEDFVKSSIEKINKALDSSTIDTSAAVIDDEEKKELTDCIKQIFENRNKAIVSRDLELIESIYDTKTKYGTWAFEHEKRKVEYIHNWEQKQGVKFIDITPKVIVKSIKGSGDKFSIYLICSTEYKYVYEDNPEELNRSRTGTYHVLNIKKNDDGCIITKEWYKDPFADSLNLGNLKVDSIREHILAQNSRDLSDMGERRIKAIEYADKYCGAASEEQFGFKYNKKYRNYNPQGGDCANFASQILFEGGGFKKNRAWNYDGRGATGPWLNADKFKNYMIHSGRASLIAYGNYEKVYKASYKLLPGDFVAYEKKGDITHISVVTGADSKGYSLVTCHNSDRDRVPWDLGWSDKNMKFWLVRVHY